MYLSIYTRNSSHETMTFKLSAKAMIKILLKIKIILIITASLIITLNINSRSNKYK